MEEWRPPDWENPNKDVLKMEPSDDGSFHSQYNILKMQYFYYEAGADAILKALKPLILEIAPSSKLIDVLYKGKQ